MLKISLRYAWLGLKHSTRILLLVTLLLGFIIGGGVLTLRYWVLPDIERYHEDIAGAVSQAIGQPVSIGRIEADWRGVHPHLSLNDVRILDRNKPGQTALDLRHVDGEVSWMTLLRGAVRLRRLELDSPELQVRRDAQGGLHVAGIELSADASGKSGLADWLLHQRYVAVRDARIVWLDEQRAAPPLVFERLNLLIENRGRHHRFALHALPPPQLSSELDVRGDFAGRSFDDLAAWGGELYTRLDYADMGAWRTWVQLPEGFHGGRGALRAWLGVSGGSVSRITADLALAEVRAQLGGGLPPLDLHTLRGRLGWQESERGTEIFTRELALRTDAVELPPTDFYLRRDMREGLPTGGEVRSNGLDMTRIVALADALPLGQHLKRQLEEFAPRGRVSGLRATWQGEAGRPERYEFRAKFEELALRRTENFPGFSGLSGEVDGSDKHGTLHLNARMLKLDAPGIMPEPLAFDTLTAQLAWQAGRHGMEVKFSNVSAANEDLAGTMFGSYQPLPGSPGLIDLNINLGSAAIRHADRYIPVAALDGETHAWLREALQGGQAEDFRLRLHGDLNEFPFAEENSSGLFRIRTRIKGGSLLYAPEWPRIDNIAGDLLVEGKRLEVVAPSAMTTGVRLQKVNVTMPDMGGQDMLLQVRGEAVGETARGLDFIRQSPVRGYIDGFTDDMTASGNGNLRLSVDVPLGGGNPAVVSGSYRFLDNEIKPGGGAPTLYHTNGELLFSESSMNTRNLVAQIFGGPASIDVQNGAAGAVRAKVRGRADFDAFRKVESHPLLSRLHGGCEWNAEITTLKKQTDVLLTTGLSGMASDLPAPFAKKADEAIPLRFEMRNMVEGQDMLALQYGELLNARVLRREENGEMVPKRGTIQFGGMGKWLERDGIWLTGALPQLSLQGWGGLFAAPRGAAGGVPLSIAGADLVIHKLDAFGHGMSEVRVSARNRDGELSAQLSSGEINGELRWQPAGQGRLLARLKKLSLGARDSTSPQGEAATPAVVEGGDTEFPALDLSVDELMWKDKQLGRLELLAHQEGPDWLLESMRLVNPDGVLSAGGKYHKENGKAQTRIQLKLEISNAGKILARSGYPDSVKNGSGKLEGDFSWRGAPDDFSYAALDGSLRLDTGKGQFLKIEPGVGKLLGILSLQALPRHITLDFTDVFSNGFAFDNINGTAQIRQGVLETSDFRIEGSSAKVTMLGWIDLGRETQNLKVRVLPTVGSSVSLLGALSGGPLVGLGTLIVNKILREPLDKLVSFEYNVTGTWSSPNVVKTGQRQIDKPAEVNPTESK